MNKEANIFVAGHKGLVGSAICKLLSANGYANILVKTRNELDLLNQVEVNRFFESEKVDYVFLAAAKVGGILYNKKYQAEFLYENLMIAANVIHAAANNNVLKLLYLGSSCIYPRLCEQPIKEDYLLSGPLEPTNEGYAIAKIAGLKLCEKYNLQYGKKFISVMPTNLYGPGDNFHPDNSHVIPGMMRRFHQAMLQNQPCVTLWGSGNPKREFLHVNDLAQGLYLLMQKYDEPLAINIGSGKECSIRQLAELMREVVGYKGDIEFNTKMPDGTPRKILDVKKIEALGWKPRYTLRDGLIETYEWALENNII